MLLLLLSGVQAGVRINEIVYQVAGTDGGYEWVELCSTELSSVDLTGYTVEMAGNSWDVVFTFGASGIAPGEYPVIGSSYATISGSFSSDLENAGSYIDAIRLKDAGGTVVDTVFYGQSGSATNNYALLDDSASTDPLRAAPVAPEGESIGRIGCADTDNSAVDFILLPAISPAAENQVVLDTGGDTGTGGDSGSGGDTGTGGDTGDSGTGIDCSSTGRVRINEFLANPAGSDDGLEWLELYNSGDAPAQVGGWELLWDTSDFDTASSYLLPDTVIPPRSWLVIGSGGLDTQLSLGNGTDGDGLRLNCGVAVVDTVIYGGSNGAGFPDDSGATATSIAPPLDEAFSIVREVDGVDTDQSGEDFLSCDQPSPGAANLCIIRPCLLTDEVVINEFSQETDAEFLELKNVSGADVDLSGYLVRWATSASSGYNHTVTLPDQVILGPGEYYVIGTPVADNSHLDLQADMDFGNATSNADGLRLVCDDGAERVLDTVIYAAANKLNDDAWTGDDGAVATSLAPTADDGQAVGRIPDGQDTDQCGTDFVVEPVPTPGAENVTDIVPPGECVPGAQIRINEVLYDSEDDDATGEWIELYNDGDTEVDIGGYWIEGAKSSWDIQYVLGGGSVIAPGGFFVIGAGVVPEQDVEAEDLDLGNGTGTDGVRLVDCEGAVLDTVLYGDAAEDEITGDGGSTDRLNVSDAGISIGRFPDGQDTDTVDDWIYYFAPTPGASNLAPPDTKDTCIPSGCERCPDATGVDRGCATALPLSGWEFLLGVLFLRRRRK